MTCCRPASFAAWAIAVACANLLLGREVLPEERDAERPVGAFECPLQTLHVINVGGDNLGTKLGQVLSPCPS